MSLEWQDDRNFWKLFYIFLFLLVCQDEEYFRIGFFFQVFPEKWLSIMFYLLRIEIRSNWEKRDDFLLCSISKLQLIFSIEMNECISISSVQSFNEVPQMYCNHDVVCHWSLSLTSLSKV